MSFVNSKVILELGTIIEVVPGPRCYTVQTASGAYSCAASSPVGDGLQSPRSLGLYGVGTLVVILVPTAAQHDGRVVQSSYGYIIAAVPAQTNQNDKLIRHCDCLYGMASSAFANAAERATIAALPGQLRDFNSGQPLDGVAGSDCGVINEMGLSYGIGRFVSWLRASEIAGLWCFYNDNLTRLAAYNFEHWTAAGERWIKNDVNEVNDVELFTPYPWEALGQTFPGNTVFDEPEDGGVYHGSDDVPLLLPKKEDQLAYPRLINLRGYVGDLEQQFVVAPYNAESEGDIERYDQQSKYAGLLAIHKHISGAYTVRSAKAIVLEKTITIPVPKQIQPPEQPAADASDSEQYAAAGIDDDSHSKDEFPFRAMTTAPGVWAAALYDYSFHLANYYGMRALTAKASDWYVPEATTMGSTGVAPAYPPADITQLQSQYELDLPPYHDLKLDHRDNTARYYESKSMIAQLEDGSIVLQDGYGGAIRMGQGNIEITCPGDIWLRPGRNVNAWAPKDVIMRAGNSCDVTAGKGDVRIKAEHNMHVLSGNSGHGGILLESRAASQEGSDFSMGSGGSATQSYGIILRAVTTGGGAAAPVQVYGSDIYMRAFGVPAPLPDSGEDPDDGDAPDDNDVPDSGDDSGVADGTNNEANTPDGRDSTFDVYDEDGTRVASGLSEAELQSYDDLSRFVAMPSGSSYDPTTLQTPEQRINNAIADLNRRQAQRTAELHGMNRRTQSDIQAQPRQLTDPPVITPLLPRDASGNIPRLIPRDADGNITRLLPREPDGSIPRLLPREPDGSIPRLLPPLEQESLAPRHRDAFTVLGASEDDDVGEETRGSIIFDARANVLLSGDNITAMAQRGVTHALGKKIFDTEDETAAAIINKLDKEDSDAIQVNRFTAGHTYIGGKSRESVPHVFYCGAKKVMFDNAGAESRHSDDVGKNELFVVTGRIDVVEGVHSYYPQWRDETRDAYKAPWDADKPIGVDTVITSHHFSAFGDDIRGAADFISKFGFTLRSTQQYRLGEGFYVPEALWQQMASSAGPRWSESAVEPPGSSGVSTLPHPGYDSWNSDTYVGYRSQIWHATENAVPSRDSGSYDLKSKTEDDLIQRSSLDSYVITQH